MNTALIKMVIRGFVIEFVMNVIRAGTAVSVTCESIYITFYELFTAYSF